MKKIKNFAVPDYNKVQPMYSSLSSAVQLSRVGKEYAVSLKKWQKTAVGAMAPDFTMADTSGKMVSLHDFKGRYVLVDFWASWCKPCRQENPNVVKAYNNYKDKNFTVLGVSLDDPGGKEKWMKAIHDDGLMWTQVSDLKGWKTAAAKLYVVEGIPLNFLVNPEGKIVGKNLRGDDLENKLKELL